ncbi:MAG TPA: hypothetical protein PKY88_11095 [Anaerohalosphaeraceae bacterium]|nr:hypothetical protein [Anaerohalosphaeraceae bacterium]
MITIIFFLVTITGLLSFGAGYSFGKRKVLIDPRHDYIMAVFHLILLKNLDESKYDIVREGIVMRAREHVCRFRMYEKRLSDEKLKYLKEKIGGYELIENADKILVP